MPRVLGGSLGDGRLLMSEIPLYAHVQINVERKRESTTVVLGAADAERRANNSSFEKTLLSGSQGQNLASTV